MVDSSNSSEVQVDFALAIGPGRLDVSVPVPVGEVTLTQILPALRGLTNHIVESVVANIEGDGARISCHAGCGACCRQMVPLSIFEAEALSAWIRELPEENQHELRQRFHAALLALKQSGMLDRMDPAEWVDGSSQAKTLAIDYLAAGVACPFLVEESCGIHPIRPLICREYLVTSPPEFCSSPSTLQVVGVPMPVKPSRGLFRLGGQIERHGRGWIPLVFLFAWMEIGATPGKEIAGTGPEVLYRFIQAVTAP